jgi:hypothetical protein
VGATIDREWMTGCPEVWMRRLHWIVFSVVAAATGSMSLNLAAQNAPAAQRQPRPAADSLPDGLSPLSAAERAVMQAPACTAEIRRIATAHAGEARTGGIIGGAQRLLAALASVSPQTDCVRFAARDTLVYLARSIGTEAQARVRQIARSMGLAAQDASPHRLCPSAPVPHDLAALRTHPVMVAAPTTPSDPWRCIGVDFEEPGRYQYEVRTAPDGQSAEIIARGFPVAGQLQPDEIFARIRVGDDAAPTLFRR